MHRQRDQTELLLDSGGPLGQGRCVPVPRCTPDPGRGAVRSQQRGRKDLEELHLYEPALCAAYLRWFSGAVRIPGGPLFPPERGGVYGSVGRS